MIKNIEVRINSDGGDVFEGLAMYDAMKRSDRYITTYVDGIAASMASILALGGKKCVMATNARIMIHAPQGRVAGTANDLRATAEQMDKLTADMKAIYKAKTNQPDKVIDAWMADKKDTWFTAVEAKAAGLCDEIQAAIAAINDNDLNGVATAEIVSRFEKQLSHQNKNKMNKDLLIALLGLKADATDAEITAALQSLKNENAQLQAKLIQAESSIKAERKAAIESEITAAIKAEKFTEAERPVFTALLENDLENGRAAIAKIQGKVAVTTLTPTQIIAQAGATLTAPVTMSFMEMSKKDPKGLEKMEKENPAQFIALYKSQFGVEPDMKG